MLKPSANFFTLFLAAPSYVGDLQIDVEVKKYFCKAGVKGMQVGQISGPFLQSLCPEGHGLGEGGLWNNRGCPPVQEDTGPPLVKTLIFLFLL